MHDNHASFCRRASGIRPEPWMHPYTLNSTLIFMIPVTNPITYMQVNLLWNSTTSSPSQMSEPRANSQQPGIITPFTSTTRPARSDQAGNVCPGAWKLFRRSSPKWPHAIPRSFKPQYTNTPEWQLPGKLLFYPGAPVTVSPSSASDRMRST